MGHQRDLVIARQLLQHLRTQVAVGVVGLVKVVHLGRRAGELAPKSGAGAAQAAQARVGVEPRKAAGNMGFEGAHGGQTPGSGCRKWTVRSV